MAKQTIGLGTVANDGTGDDLRSAGDKINDNFDELYAADVTLTAAIAAVLAGHHPGFVAGRWYCPAVDVAIGAGVALTANRIAFTPFILARSATISDLATRITTVASGGNIQLAIYAADATTKLPSGSALAATGNLSTTSLGAVSADITGSDVTLPPGLYWGAVNADATAGATVICAAPGTTIPHLVALIGSTTLGNVVTTAPGSISRYYAQTFGTWPDMTGQTTTEVANASCAQIFIKAA